MVMQFVVFPLCAQLLLIRQTHPFLGSSRQIAERTRFRGFPLDTDMWDFEGTVAGVGGRLSRSYLGSLRNYRLGRLWFTLGRTHSRRVCLGCRVHSSSNSKCFLGIVVLSAQLLLYLKKVLLSGYFFSCFLFFFHVATTWTTLLLIAHIQTLCVFLETLLYQIFPFFLSLNDAFIVTSFLFWHSVSFFLILF